MNDQVTTPNWALVIRHSLVILVWSFVISTRANPLEGFRRSQPFDEQIRQQTIDDVRILIDAADSFDPTKPTQLIFYALPVGNSIAQTVGCREAQGRDWHFYIQ